MRRQISIDADDITIGDLQRFLAAADDIDADENTPVNITAAPKYHDPRDPGGEITMSVTTTT